MANRGNNEFLATTELRSYLFDLPSDVLCCIIEQLNLFDRYRFAMVRRQWYSFPPSPSGPRNVIWHFKKYCRPCGEYDYAHRCYQQDPLSPCLANSDGKVVVLDDDGDRYSHREERREGRLLYREDRNNFCLLLKESVDTNWQSREVTCCRIFLIVEEHFFHHEYVQYLPIQGGRALPQGISHIEFLPSVAPSDAYSVQY